MESQIKTKIIVSNKKKQTKQKETCFNSNLKSCNATICVKAFANW